ncbi:MAG: hypothetical protein K2I42_07540 [Anaeroplasmataceae bacterium]|nr:hypothetical protein [Anaeroplasmataceae bacterium]
MRRNWKYLCLILIPAWSTIILFVVWIITKQAKLMYVLGFSLGVLIACLMMMILSLFIRRKGLKECHFDERQLKSRGDCFCVSFFVLLGSLFLDGILRLLLEYEWSSYIVGVTTCGMLSIGVFACLAIVKDAYTSIGENKLRFGIFLGCFGVFDIIIGIINSIRSGFLEEGKVGIPFINIFSGIVIFFIAILLFIKTQMMKKNEEMNDEKFETEIC